MISTRMAWLAAVVSGVCTAANVQFPTNPFVVPGLSTTGASFTYSGTLTQNDTIAFTQSGNPCLQTGGTGYCVNGAGVLTVAATVGVTPVGGSSSFAGPSGVIPAGTWTYGALLLTISGVGTVPLFPTNAGNGLGSATPPASLTLAPTTLSALGFGTFSQVNPTITLILADTGYADNGGQYSLAQAVTPPVPGAAIPTLGEGLLLATIVLLAGMAMLQLRRRT